MESGEFDGQGDGGCGGVIVIVTGLGGLLIPFFDVGFAKAVQDPVDPNIIARVKAVDTVRSLIILGGIVSSGLLNDSSLSIPTICAIGGLNLVLSIFNKVNIIRH